MCSILWFFLAQFKCLLYCDQSINPEAALVRFRACIFKSETNFLEGNMTLVHIIFKTKVAMFVALF